MNLLNIPLFEAMQQKMQYHSSRQAVLAQNVANADTPGYMAKDMDAPNFGAMLGTGMIMATTNAKHMQPGMNGSSGSGRIADRKNTYELNPIGNSVVLEEEVMRVAENQAEYQKTTSMYKKSLEMFRIALGKASGG